MKHVNGMVLLFALIILMVMSLIVSSMLIISQMSHKAAHAGQQQLFISRQAFIQHMDQISAVQNHEPDNAMNLSSCPAQYAAWSGGTLHCELLQLNTQALSDNKLFYNSYGSVLIKQTLVMEKD